MKGFFQIIIIMYQRLIGKLTITLGLCQLLSIFLFLNINITGSRLRLPVV